MSRRVVPHDLPPPLLVDRRGGLLPYTHLAGDHRAEMRDRTLGHPLRVLDADPAAWRGDDPRVADLAAGLRVEGSPLEKDVDPVSFADGIDVLAGLAYAADIRFGGQLAVACELRPGNG